MNIKPTNGKPSIFWSPTLKSPLGSALFAKLEEPDVFKGGDPTWKITLILDPTLPSTKAFYDQAAAFAAEFSKSCGKTVEYSSIFRADKNSGSPTITFKSKAKQGDDGKFVKIPVVDGNKNPTNEPWNGDQCVVAFKFGGWSSPFGVGIKAYLSAVQVVAKRPKGVSSANAADVFDTAAPLEELPF